MHNPNGISRKRFVIGAAVTGGGVLAGGVSTGLTPKTRTTNTGAITMSAYLQITLKIKDKNREAAAALYGKYKKPFLDKITGAKHSGGSLR